jgi:protein ImuA
MWMGQAKTDIIARLRQDVLLLQGFKPATNSGGRHFFPLPLRQAFPNAAFPVAALHEFIYHSPENKAASSGFISGIASALTTKGGALLWIGAAATVFPPALTAFGITPEKIIFLHTRNEKEKTWAMEEALRCEGLCAVIADIKEISFTESRKFQLAMEQSGVTAFLMRNNPKNIATSAVTRWKITPVKTNNDPLPGVGFPCWNVELQKVRNGKPGNWELEWKARKFSLAHQQGEKLEQPLKKIV